MRDDRTNRVGPLLVTGGILFFVSFASEILIASPEANGEVVDLPLYVLYTGFMAVGVVILAIGVWSVRTIVGATIGRLGRVGAYLCIAGFVSYLLMAMMAAVVAARTGHTPDIFVFFGVAIVLTAVGPTLLGMGFRRLEALGAARFLPFFASAGAVLSLTPWHDFGLAVFSLSWVVLGAVWWNSNPAAEQALG